MTFYVEASNIHTGEYNRYGPFPGSPGLTYDNLHGHHDGGPDFLFTWVDPQDVGDIEENPHDYETWIDSDNRIRFDGWRRSEDRQGAATVIYQELVGPFYTDLYISFTND